MKTSRIFIYIITFFLLILLTGCIDVNRHFSEVKDKIMGELRNDYKTEFQFSVGSAAITVSSWFVDLAADQDYIDDMMREIDNVQIGVYQKIKNFGVSLSYKSLISIENEMKSNGWKSIVRSVDNGELNAVFIRSNPEEILNRIYVINYSDEELVLIEVEGDLKQIIEYAIEERKFDVKM